MEKRRQHGTVIPVEMSAHFFFERAVRFLDRNNYHKALKYFQRAVEQEPDNPVNHCNLAGALAEIGLYEESNDVLQFVLEEVDRNYTEAYFYMANNWANLEEYELAEECIIRYLEEEPGGLYEEQAREMLGAISRWLGRPPREARSQLDILLLKTHDQARYLLEEGHFHEAIHLLEKILNEDPDFTAAKNNLTLAYYYTNRMAKAMEMVREVLARDPGNIHALCNLAVLYEQQQDKERLEKLLEALTRLFPMQLEHLYKLATTLGILGRHEAAYRRFRLLVQLGATDDPCIYHYTAVAAANIGRIAEAVRWWKKAVAIDPLSSVPRFYLRVMTELDADMLPRSFPYHYRLPIEEQLQHMDPYTLQRGIREGAPWLRSALHWGLRYGDFNVKLQVLQAYGFIGDKEAVAELKNYLLEPQEPDYLKKYAIFVLRYMGVTGPFEVYLAGRRMLFDLEQEKNLSKWALYSQTVLSCVTERLKKQYEDLVLLEAQSIWLNFITNAYPELPQIRKVNGMGAALEYLTLKRMGKAVKQKDVAYAYGVSTSTLGKNLKLIQNHLDV